MGEKLLGLRISMGEMLGKKIDGEKFDAEKVEKMGKKSREKWTQKLSL